MRWKTFCRVRLTDPLAGASLVMDELHERVTAVIGAETTTEQQKEILKNLQVYADSLIAACQ